MSAPLYGASPDEANAFAKAKFSFFIIYTVASLAVLVYVAIKFPHYRRRVCRAIPIVFLLSLALMLLYSIATTIEHGFAMTGASWTTLGAPYVFTMINSVTTIHHPLLITTYLMLAHSLRTGSNSSPVQFPPTQYWRGFNWVCFFIYAIVYIIKVAYSTTLVSYTFNPEENISSEYVGQEERTAFASFWVTVVAVVIDATLVLSIAGYAWHTTRKLKNAAKYAHPPRYSIQKDMARFVSPFVILLATVSVVNLANLLRASEVTQPSGGSSFIRYSFAVDVVTGFLKVVTAWTIVIVLMRATRKHDVEADAIRIDGMGNTRGMEVANHLNEVHYVRELKYANIA